jgi:hypothetical protein
MTTLKAFIAQYIGWTANHALLDPYRAGYGNLVPRWTIFLRVSPLLLLSIPMMRKVPKSWLAVIEITCLQILAVPEFKFVLQMLPFLCVMTVKTLTKEN